MSIFGVFDRMLRIHENISREAANALTDLFDKMDKPTRLDAKRHEEAAVA